MPILKTSYTKDDTKCEMGAIAYALNGVSIFSGAVDSECGILDVTDAEAEWGSFDCCSGHSELSGMHISGAYCFILTSPARVARARGKDG